MELQTSFYIPENVFSTCTALKTLNFSSVINFYSNLENIKKTVDYLEKYLINDLYPYQAKKQSSINRAFKLLDKLVRIWIESCMLLSGW